MADKLPRYEILGSWVLYRFEWVLGVEFGWMPQNAPRRARRTRRMEQIKGIHEAQLLTYMKLAGVKIGLLVNFNVTRLKSGIKRFVL